MDCMRLNSQRAPFFEAPINRLVGMQRIVFLTPYELKRRSGCRRESS
jgi:hypothetical protein